jgi:hypothetical protein
MTIRDPTLMQVKLILSQRCIVFINRLLTQPFQCSWRRGKEIALSPKLAAVVHYPILLARTILTHFK